MNDSAMASIETVGGRETSEMLTAGAPGAAKERSWLGDAVFELYQQIDSAIERLNASLKIPRTAATDNLVMFLTVAVLESGKLERVDKAVLSQQGRVAKIAAVQLLPYQRSYKQVEVSTDIAIATPVAQSLERLAALRPRRER